MDRAEAGSFIDGLWDGEIVAALCDYIRIPNKSPAFDPDWAAHEHMDRAVALFETWAREKLKALPGAALEVVRLPGRTPLIFIEVPGSAPGTVLMYGHLDKQPEMKGWSVFEGNVGGPWEPVIKDGRLYGRGGADDGYAMFAALSALLALKQQDAAHARCVIVIEASEESGSPDLPAYIEYLSERIGTPDLVVCLDSGCGNYDQLWLTTSLRGMMIGNLTVRVLNEGVHSGAASGIVPSSFRIARQLLSRIEEEATGRMTLEALFVPVPDDRKAQADAAAKILGDEVFSELPFAGGTRPMATDNAARILEKTWMPQLAVTAIDGYPLPENGGNVLLPYTSLKLSLRLPPTCDAEAARLAVKTALERDPPSGAEVTFDAPRGENGWNAPSLAPWLEAALAKASNAAFGAPVAFQGEGGSIPFMAMLGTMFPKTQFVVTGVLGPHSNAHGPNEFLDIACGKKVSAAIASILADHAGRGRLMLFDRSEGASNRPLLLFILVALAVGAGASLFTEPNIAAWYAGLAKPGFSPPNWLFAPVWTTLYVLMAVAAWRVWRITGLHSLEMKAYGVQLALNFFWSAIFFSLHRIGAALAEMGALWLAILVTLILFWRRDRIAGLLLVPYLAWVSFAFALNLAIWRLNG